MAASVAHEIGISTLHIHLQLMEREVKKLKATDADAPLDLADPDAAANHAASIRKLETYLEIAKGEINRLDYIISQFLQAIRPTRPELKPVSLNDILLDTLTLLGPEIENREVTLSQHFAKELPNAPLDEVQVKQALVNLIKNAIQAMTQGGVLGLTTIAETDGVLVYVADTGAVFRRRKSTASFSPISPPRKKAVAGPNDCSAYCARTRRLH